jgi:hypothetical protein
MRAHGRIPAGCRRRVTRKRPGEESLTTVERACWKYTQRRQLAQLRHSCPHEAIPSCQGLRRDRIAVVLGTVCRPIGPPAQKKAGSWSGFRLQVSKCSHRRAFGGQAASRRRARCQDRAAKAFVRSRRRACGRASGDRAYRGTRCVPTR